MSGDARSMFKVLSRCTAQRTTILLRRQGSSQPIPSSSVAATTNGDDIAIVISGWTNRRLRRRRCRYCCRFRPFVFRRTWFASLTGISEKISELGPTSIHLGVIWNFRLLFVLLDFDEEDEEWGRRFWWRRWIRRGIWKMERERVRKGWNFIYYHKILFGCYLVGQISTF